MTAIMERPVRSPLMSEMLEAGETALREQDPLRAAFYRGLFTGYAIAFGLHDRATLDSARNTPFSANLHLDFWRPHFAADEDTYYATGVRRGYWLGTSERPDADECVLCGERLIEDLDAVDWCDDGLFCEWDDHRREWHASAGHDATCGS